MTLTGLRYLPFLVMAASGTVIAARALAGAVAAHGLANAQDWFSLAAVLLILRAARAR